MLSYPATAESRTQRRSGYNCRIRVSFRHTAEVRFGVLPSAGMAPLIRHTLTFRDLHIRQPARDFVWRLLRLVTPEAAHGLGASLDDMYCLVIKAAGVASRCSEFWKRVAVE